MSRLCDSGEALSLRGLLSRRARLALVLVLVVAPAAAFAKPVLGTCRALPKAPTAPSEGISSVWTGREMLLFGRVTRRARDGAVLGRVNVAAAYDPAANAWRRLP